MPSSQRSLLAVFAVTIFVSAALLFAVQPMFTKMVLPQLGGAPSVWSVAMVFFQAVLLAGYAYAHLLTRFIPGWPSAFVHIAVMIAATFVLPLAIASGWGEPPPAREALWLVGLFAASIGLPFFALSANGPLLQAWFARTDHPSAKNPYFLYAASNVGSFLALIAYPAVVEPFTRLGSQTRVWSGLFMGLIALLAACGIFLKTSHDGGRAEGAHTTAPTWRDAATWVALAAVPSALLVAVTAHLSTDVGAVPLMWVMPLALYLATFVIVFQSKPALRHEWMLVIQPPLLILLVAAMIFNTTKWLIPVIALNLATFFISAIVCHGELARRKPAANHLTAFYMWMSFGGMIGGLASGLVAPYVFSWIAEYPLLIVLAVLCRPGLVRPDTLLRRALWMALGVLMTAIALEHYVFRFDVDDTVFRIVIIALMTVSVLMWRRPLPFAVVLALAILLGRMYEPDGGRRESIRSFFGVHKIVDTLAGDYRVLLHGTTIHGAQRLLDADGKPIEGKPEPLTYYHANSPMAQALADARERAGRPLRVAIVGLGTGSLSCYAQPGDTWRFYEIDSSVVRFSHDEPRFDFMRQCAPNAEIVLGDARVMLSKHQAEPYDIIIVDAFSSDAIPVHLLTREAVAVYRDKLAQHGTLALHVSNRHLELATVAIGIATANGLSTLMNDGNEAAEDDAYKFSSTVIVAARNPDDLATLADRTGWSQGEPDPAQWVWTDDYSNVVGAIIRKLRGE